MLIRAFFASPADLYSQYLRRSAIYPVHRSRQIFYLTELLLLRAGAGDCYRL